MFIRDFRVVSDNTCSNVLEINMYKYTFILHIIVVKMLKFN